MDVSFLDQVLDKFSGLEGTTAYAVIFGILVACGLGLPIPEDVTLVSTGYLAYLENIDLKMGILVGFFGVLLGDLVLFFLGRIFGKKFLNLPGVRFVLTADRVNFAQSKLKKNARKVCFTARFIAGLRAPIFFSAGILGVKPQAFLSIDALAAMISVPVLIYVGYYFGDEIDVGLLYIRKTERYVMITLAVVGLFVIFHIVRKKLIDEGLARRRRKTDGF